MNLKQKKNIRSNSIIKKNYKPLTLKEVKIKLQKDIENLKKKLLGIKKKGFWISFYFKSKDGDKGLGNLNEFSTFLEFFSLKKSDFDSYKIYGGLKITSLYSGRPSSVGWNNVGFGKPDNNYKSSAKGISPYIGLYWKTEKGWIFDLFASTTPITGIINPTFTYDLSVGYNGQYYLELYRLPVEESLLSYVGNQVKDAKWGRVVENGIGFGIKWKLNKIGIENKFAYAFDISGRNTVKNTAIKDTLLIYTDIKNNFNFLSSFEHALVGPIFVYSSYKRNTNFFTYGHGGYFSPQLFALIGLFWDLKKNFDNRDSMVKITGNLGLLTFKEDAAPKYPLADSKEQFSSNRENSLGFSLKVIYFKRLAQKVWLNIFASLDKSRDYMLFDGGIGINYYFSSNFLDFLELDERELKTIDHYRDLYPPN
jgi:hypothetical protein